jgi:cysteine desulfurase
MVTLMHANNEVGSMLDLAAASALCQKYGAYQHSDTVQTVGHYPINVQEVPIDFISGAAHKFFGPKGVGFIYINHRVKMHPYIDGGSQERNMRAGTENIAGIVGLAKALQLATEEYEKDLAYISDLKSYMKERLVEICPEVVFNGHPTENLYSVLSVSFPPGPHAELMIMSLDIAGISVSGGSACSSGAESQSHVMEAIGHPSNRKTVRFSLCSQNTKEEIDYTIEKLEGILSTGIQVPS